MNNATLNRFFALHFVLPFVLAALALMHLIALHDSAGSGNPLGVSGNYDRLPFAPYFIFKDLITIFIFILVLSMLVFFVPNLLGDSENYVMADPMKTPSAIIKDALLCPTIRSYFANTIKQDDDENTLDPAQDEQEVDEHEKGFITLDRQKQEITKKEHKTVELSPNHEPPPCELRKVKS